MRLEHVKDVPVLHLSRRNLVSLLAKLDGNPPNSACTLVAPSANIVVHAEEDDVHYAHESREGAPAGYVHPSTAAAAGLVP